MSYRLDCSSIDEADACFAVGVDSISGRGILLFLSVALFLTLPRWLVGRSNFGKRCINLISTLVQINIEINKKRSQSSTIKNATNTHVYLFISTS